MENACCKETIHRFRNVFPPKLNLLFILLVHELLEVPLYIFFCFCFFTALVAKFMAQATLCTFKRTLLSLLPVCQSLEYLEYVVWPLLAFPAASSACDYFTLECPKWFLSAVPSLILVVKSFECLKLTGCSLGKETFFFLFFRGDSHL